MNAMFKKMIDSPFLDQPIIILVFFHPDHPVIPNRALRVMCSDGIINIRVTSLTLPMPYQ